MQKQPKDTPKSNRDKGQCVYLFLILLLAALDSTPFDAARNAEAKSSHLENNLKKKRQYAYILRQSELTLFVHTYNQHLSCRV